MEKKEKKIYQSPIMTVYEISRTQILAGSGQTEPITEGHGDRYIGSLFRVDAPVPDDFAWASESIEFGSAFVSIYGKASSCALFLTA